MPDNPPYTVITSGRFKVRVEWSELARRWRITGSEGIWDGWRDYSSQDDAEMRLITLPPFRKEDDGFRWWAVVLSRDSDDEEARLAIVSEDPADEIHQLTVQAAGPVWLAECRSKGGPALLQFGNRVVGRIHPNRVITHRGTSAADGPGWTHYRP